MNLRTNLFPAAATLAVLAPWATAQASPGPEPATGGARVIEPGPRWTGRTIVHVKRDDALHRLEMKAIGALRRSRADVQLSERIGAYSAEMDARMAPVAELCRAHGAKLLGTNWLVNTVNIEGMTPELQAALLERDDVEMIQADQWCEPQLGIATDAQHHNSDAANLMLSAGVPTKGDGVVIAIIDSGIDADMGGTGRPHAAFYPDGNPANPTGPGLGGSRLLSAESQSLFVPMSGPEDVCGHGTRMASIAAGAMFNSLPDVDDGPAPNALIRSYKISDLGVGECLASVLGMDKAFAAVVAQPDVTVANMSYDGTNDPLASPNQAIADAVLADVFVSLSAGNDGASLAFAHGSYNALVVGSSFVGTKEPYVFPGFQTSAIGPLNGRVYPQILAVGEAMTCAKIDDEASSQDSYGTSAAAAFVAGTAALVRQADPTLTALEVRALLLNTTDEVVLGNPNAAGYGYLRSDRAVEDALAGLVVQQTVTTGETRKHPAFLLAGESRTFTLAWLRETANDTTIDDLDLRVRGPQGNLIAWSASQLDNTEQIRITATDPGVYIVEVVPIKFDGDGTAEYALAGVDVEAFDPSTCLPGVPMIDSHSPPVVPTLTQAYEWITSPQVTNQVTLTGCHFTGATIVTVSGKNYQAKVIDDNTLTFNLAVAPAIGQLPLSVTTPGGVAASTLTVVPFNVLATTPTIDINKMGLKIAGTPNHFYALAFSPDLAPTVVPGLFSVDIGNGGATLFPFLFGNLNAVNGVEEFIFQGPALGSLPPSTKAYFQGLTLDNVSLTPPWTSTNPSSVLKFP